MKHIAIIGLLITGLWACMPTASESELPEDIAGLRAFIEERKSALKDINQSITEAEEKLAMLDTTTRIINKTLVTAMEVTPRTFEHFVQIQGSVQSDDVVNASSEMGGRIIYMKWDEGDYINRGQLVARTDTQALDKTRQEVLVSLDLAKTVYEKQKRLWEQEIGSEIQYLQAKNNVERLEKSLETLATQMKKANVYAPMGGVVDRVMLKQGEMASPGMPILTILNTQKVKVVTDVPERYLGKVKRGDMVTIRFPALDQELQAKVSLIGRTISPANRTFNVEVELDNRKGILKPNLLAEMLLKDEEIKEAIVLPMYLVQQEVGGKQFVLVRGECPDGTCAQKKYVETGSTYEGEIVVESGLDTEDQIIVEGARGLIENEIIEIKAQSVSNESK